MVAAIQHLNPSTLGSFYSAVDYTPTATTSNLLQKEAACRMSMNPRTNPFHVLYDLPDVPFKTHNINQDEERIMQQQELQQGKLQLLANEQDMEQKLIQGTGAQEADDEQIIQIDERPGIYKTGSIISRSATLKKRNRIKKRKSSLKESGLKARLRQFFEKKRSKFLYLFLARRRSSLRRSSLRKRNSNFNNFEEFQKFLVSTSSSLTYELLPREMLLYYYARLYLPLPKLQKILSTFELDNNKELQAIPTHKKVLIPSNPMKETLTKNGVPLQMTETEEDFNDAYRDFKEYIFSKKTVNPSWLEENFAGDNNVDEEILRLNTTLLFEVLLRRIIAAKLQYRLENAYYTSSSVYSESVETSNTNN